jgi:hypothetical protein
MYKLSIVDAQEGDVIFALVFKTFKGDSGTYLSTHFSNCAYECIFYNVFLFTTSKYALLTIFKIEKPTTQ